MTTSVSAVKSVTAGRGESFLHWVKRHVGWMSETPEGRRIVNLATSGVQTVNSANWFQRTCRERLPDLLERMEETNEFGLPALKRAVRLKYRIPDDREIYLTAGASAGYRLVCDALLTGRRGAQVLVESPTYEPLVVLPKRVGANVVSVPIPIKRANGDILEAFARAVTPSTTAIVLTNLHNPTGSLLELAEIEQLVRMAKSVAPGSPSSSTKRFSASVPNRFETIPTSTRAW